MLDTLEVLDTTEVLDIGEVLVDVKFEYLSCMDILHSSKSMYTHASCYTSSLYADLVP